MRRQRLRIWLVLVIARFLAARAIRHRKLSDGYMAAFDRLHQQAKEQDAARQSLIDGLTRLLDRAEATP